jgi:hypothetical protein
LEDQCVGDYRPDCLVIEWIEDYVGLADWIKPRRHLPKPVDHLLQFASESLQSLLGQFACWPGRVAGKGAKQGC